MKKPNSELPLKSSFTASGKLKVPVRNLITRLQTMPSLKLLKDRGVPTLSFIESGLTRGSEIMVEGNKLILNYQFQRMSLKEYTKNLARFLSLLAYTSDLYEVDLGSIYQYLTEVLIRYAEEMHNEDGKLWNARLLAKQAKGLADMNCSLSLKIVELQAECVKLRSDRALLVKFFEDVSARASERVGNGENNRNSLPRILGTSTETYDAVASITAEVSK
jgi:hypothetical protein